MSDNFSCIEYSSTFQHEKKAFSDLVQNGKNVIFMNLIYNFTASDLPLDEMKSKKWLWIEQDFKYLLSLPQDVDVFSFGLLKARKDYLTVKIIIRNFTEANCKLNVDTYLSHYLAHITENMNSTMNAIFEESKGHICFAKIETNNARDYISNISGVKIGFPFHCYIENNKYVPVEKSYVIYIVISIIFFFYSLYPIFIEMPFYIEDRKTVDGNYYLSDSPCGLSIIIKRLIFSGNNKTLATLRIIIIVISFTSLVYYLKSEIYYSCDCSMELSNVAISFQDAENLYISSPGSISGGILYFILVHVCVFSNSNGELDDFVFLNFVSLCNRYCRFMTVLNVSVFMSPSSMQGKQVSYKIQKLSLLFSYQFWTQILFINLDVKPHCSLMYVFYPIQMLFNIGFALCSILCPVVFTVYVLFFKRISGCLHTLLFRKCELRCVRCYEFIFVLIFHVSAIAYFVFTYKYTFNIFFNGISYIIQFLIYTLLLAVPRFPIQTYIYVIFITSIIIYVSRFVYQFTKLYKNLLETILSVQEQNSIPIKHFNKIVAKHFPLSIEVFYLFVKIMLSSLFFAIIFYTMRIVGYIKFGAQPDLTTIISLIFLFGPPRLVEALLVTDFTSRVHMIEKELKADIEALANNEQLQPESNLLYLTENIYLCKSYQNDGCICKTLRYFCTFFCGCFRCPVDENGFCECFVLLASNFKQRGRVIVRIPTICIYNGPFSENEADQIETHRSNSQNRSSIISTTSNESNRPLLRELNGSNPNESNEQISTELISLNQGASYNLSSGESKPLKYLETYV